MDEELTKEPSTFAPRPASAELYPYGSSVVTEEPVFKTVTLWIYGDLDVIAAPVAYTNA